MSDLTALQADLEKYKNELKLSYSLRDIKLTPAWKEIIDKGFVEGLTNELMMELAYIDEEKRQQCLNVLTGISAFKQYIEEVQEKGASAPERIAITEEAIIQLLGEEQ